MDEDRKDYKLFIRVTEDQYERFTMWAKRLGITYSQFGRMCVQAGMNAIVRALSAEEVFTTSGLPKDERSK